MGEELKGKGVVLVVDDDSSSLTIVERVLSRRGYVVTTVSSGFDAEPQLARGGVDVLLVDKHLPGMSGPQIIEAARKLQPDIATVMMTAYPDRASLSALNLDGYLSKPFRSLKDIEDAVAAALERRQRRALQAQLQRTMEQLKHQTR